MVITLRDTSSEKENYETQSPDDETGQEGWRQRAQEDLIEKYTLIIATAHDTGCLWQKKGSDRMVQRLALAHPATAITGLRERYESLVAIADKLPLHPSPPKDFDFVSLQTLVAPLLLKSIAKPSTPSNSQAPSEAMDPPTEPAASSTESPNIPTNYTQPSINRAALIFAFFGWQATEPGPRSGMAKCEACFRTLGLWLYKPSSPSATPVIDCLYVAGEHRDYCPWVNPISQSGVVSSTSALDTDSVLEGLAGWEVLVKVVLAELMRRKREDEPTGPMRVQEVSDDAVSEVADIPNLATPQEDRAKIEKKDKDLMAKLKRVAQKFRIGKGKKGPSAGPSSGGAVA